MTACDNLVVAADDNPIGREVKGGVFQGAGCNSAGRIADPQLFALFCQWKEDVR